MKKKVPGAPSVSVEIDEKPIIQKKTISPTDYKTIGDCFVVQEVVYEVLKFNIKKKINCMLLGATGLGKTELVANIAAELGLPFTAFDMGTMTDPIMSLVGTHAVEVKSGITSSVFKRSRFSEVIQKPGIVLLDELSRASSAANNLLFPCLDFRRQLAMEYCFEDPTPVNIHPECVFIATANLGSQYTGTHKLDMALKDRFMILEIDPLPREMISKIIQHIYPSLNSNEVTFIVTAYCSLNEAYDNCTIGFSLSLRHIKIICSMVCDGFTIYDAFYVVIKGIGQKEGVMGVEQILKKLQ